MATADPLIVRQRETDVDLLFLRDVGPTGGFAAPAPARSVVLNLFRDTEFTAFLDRVELVSTIGYAWVGTVAGVEGSLVVLGVSDGVLTASVDVGFALYSVRISEPGRYLITQVNQAALLPDALPIAVQTEATGERPTADSGDRYDLLLIYTAAVRTAAGGTAAMNSLVTASIARVNAAYLASGVLTRCRLATALEVPYTETGNLGIDLTTSRASSMVDALRNSYAADVVSLLVSFSSNEHVGGIAYQMGRNDNSSARLAYNVCVHYAIMPYIVSLTHEIGHNQGASHEPGNGCPGVFSYSCGYTDFTNKFFTLMSYGIGCSSCTGVNQFSSSTTRYNGFATGSATQDNARTLNETRVTVANFRQSQSAIGPPSELTGSSSGSNVALRWTAPTLGTAVEYVVEAGSAPGLENLANFSTGNPATSFGAEGVGDGTYYVRVKATNGINTSNASNEVLLRVGCASAPGAPSGLTIVQNSRGNVAFRWTGASGEPRTYFLEAGSASGLANLANVDLGGPGTTFATSGVGAGRYYVRVKAANACGRSGVSNEVVLIVP